MRDIWVKVRLAVAVMLVLFVLAVVGFVYLAKHRVRVARTQRQATYIREAHQARAELPEPLTLAEAKAEYEEFVRKHTDWREPAEKRVTALRATFDVDRTNGAAASALYEHLWALGRPQDARTVAEQWTKAAPRDAEAWQALAVMCRVLDLEQEAEAAMRELERLGGHESTYACVQRSLVAHDVFDGFTAMREARKAVKLAQTDKEKAAAYHALADAHLALNSQVILSSEERWEHYRAGYEAAKKSLKYQETGRAHLQVYWAANRYLCAVKGRPEWREKDRDRLPHPGEAQEHLQKVLKRWPLYARAWSVLCLGRLDRDDRYGAWSAAKIGFYLTPYDPYRLGMHAITAEYAEIEPDATEARKLLGQVLAGKAAGDWSKVTDSTLREFAGEVAEHKPHAPARAPQVACLIYPYVRDRIGGYSMALWEMSVALRHAGRGEEALEAAQLSLQHPQMMEMSGAEMLGNAALCAAAARKPDLADQYLAQAASRKPMTACTCNDIAWQIALFGGDYDWALKQLEHAIQAVPDNLGYQDTKAYLLYKKGDYAEARKLCEKLTDAGAGGFAVGYLGLICEAEGDHEKALECLRRVEIPKGARDAEIPREFKQVLRKLEARAGKQKA